MKYSELIETFFNESYKYIKLDNDYDNGLNIKMLIKFCNLLNRKMTKDEQFIFIKRCKCDSDNVGYNNEFETDESCSQTNSADSDGETFVASYLKIFEALEEVQIESSWRPLEVANFVLSNSIKSNNPVSIYEIEGFLQNSGILEKEDIDVLLTEIRFLQSQQRKPTTEDVALQIRDLVQFYAK